MLRKSLILMILSLAGCASGPPEPISRAIHDNPSLTRVRLDIEAFNGADVRWGGIVSKIENKAEQTWIEIVKMPLRSNGKPEAAGSSEGRFIASFDRFLDPVVYEIGGRLTVVGRIDGSIQRPIGDYDYLFPIVVVDGSYLWQPIDAVAPPYYYPPPYWYYDPWYPYPWPYHRHPHRY